MQKESNTLQPVSQNQNLVPCCCEGKFLQRVQLNRKKFQKTSAERRQVVGSTRMEGSLLDPETADTTLAKDWNLPELPEGNSSLPSASQELAEIFGTSDDEDEDFSFNLNTYLTVGKGLGDMGLPDSEPKRFDSSLLGGTDSALFLSSIQESLGPGMEHLPEGGSTPSLKPLPNKKESEDTLGEGGKTVTVKKERSKLSPEKANRPSIESEASSSLAVGEQEEQALKPKTVVRKSARLQGRQESGEGETRVKISTGQQTKGDGQKSVSVSKDYISLVLDKKEELEEGTVMEKDPGKNTNIAEDAKRNENTKRKPPPPDEKMEVEVGVEREEEEADSGEEGSEEDEESDDPDKLWCICREPHDDRFMICCDRCEEWYHGDCVGITVSQGKRMEREGKEYVCPLCVDQEKQNKELREAGRSARQARRELVKEREKKQSPHHQPPPSQPSPSQPPPSQPPTSQPPTTHSKDSTPTHQRKRAHSTSSRPHSSHPHTPTPVSGDQYGLSQLFLPDNALTSPSSRGEVSSTSEEERVKVKEELHTQCIGPGCDKLAPSPSVYCGPGCVEKHSAEMLKLLSNKGVSIQTTPSEFVRGSGGVTVVEKVTGKVVMGIAAPSEKNLVGWLKLHPSYQVLLPAGKVPSKVSRVKTEGKKEAPESPTKLKPSLMDPASVRANAKRALYQILWKRCEDVGDLQDVSQEQVEKIANEIEDRLFAIHQDITPRYKTKYRSLLFNLKDTKNQGLFRKVVLKQLSPRELVRMSSEKLASEELSQWREQTIKKNLEMIKVAEEEAQALAGTIRKKTYKGDVEIETDSQDRIETIAASEAAQKLPTTPTTPTTPTPTKTHPGGTDSKSHFKPSSDSKPTTAESKSHSHSKATDSSKPASGGGGVLDILTNTTSQHGSHVFDHHCDICTGKITPPSPTSTSPLHTPTPTTATDSLNPSPDSRTVDSEVSDQDTRSPDSVGHAQEVWKGFVNMTGLANFATVAYHVSGQIEFISEILPETLQVMGRIAHVQVWDYLDKLRSSTSRDVAVLRFDMLEKDREPYLSLLRYLVQKHRCGVIGGCHHGIKDFYLVPLVEGKEVAPQLLPFQGPGISTNHPDILLGVIVRSKSRKLTKKRHHSDLDDTSHHLVKKSRHRIEVGVGEHTPPLPDNTDMDSHEDETKVTANVTLAMSGFTGYLSQAKTGTTGSEMQPNGSEQRSTDEATSGGEAMDIETDSSEDQQSHNVQMSFYGQHQPLTQANSNSPKQQETSVGTVMTASTTAPLDLPPPPGIQSILSQLSDENLKELASAMSTLGQAVPPSSVAAASVSGVTSTMTTSTAEQSKLPQVQATGGEPVVQTQSQLPQGKATGGEAVVQAPPPVDSSGGQHSSYPTPQGPPEIPPSAPFTEGRQPPYLHPQAQHQQQSGIARQQLPTSHSNFPSPQVPSNYYNQAPLPQQIPQQGGYPPNQPFPTNLHGHPQGHLQGQPQGDPQSSPQGHLQGHPQGQYPPGHPQDYSQGQQQLTQAPYPTNPQSAYSPPPQQQCYDPRLQSHSYANYPPHPPPDRRNYPYDRPPGWGDHQGSYTYETEGGEGYNNRYDDYSKLDRIETRDYGHKSGPPSRDWRREERFRQDRPYEQGGYRERPGRPR